MNKINKLITKYSDIIRMMEAYRDGEKIEWFSCGLWYEVTDQCMWKPDFEYRIKPKEPPIIVPWDVLNDDIIAVSMNMEGHFSGHFDGEIEENSFGFSQYPRTSISLRAVKGISCSLPLSEWRKSLTYRPKE